ncbi:patatin-like phospholipase family protein [Roseospira visakhapatnamensis]|uniref:PNPLA domain-containing protein n=1 Tax=Roseospira visakhapatnamensis TaxID=390880 RepID=A0A7W6W8K6_9PROT|nr:hypothetical protein [Roseospira visakhapatnamensis]
MPDAALERATVGGVTEVRQWGDEVPPNADALVTRMRERLLRRYEEQGRPEEGLSTAVLALSGGAWDGAYSAGVLNGWTACGTRPTFSVVTGISTGALVAPFAFLGPAWDDQLREAFTAPEVGEILALAPLRALFGALSLGESPPIERLVRRFASQEMLDAIGAAHRDGRRLLIGTTNLDAERPVVWDIGALANSRLPNRLILFRKIMLASSAVPGAFPPVFFDVTVDGRTYQELHVDGGVLTSIFGIPVQLDISRVRTMPFPHTLSLYMLQNNKLGPDRRVVDLRLGSILAKTASALIRSQTRGDLYRLWVSAQKHGFAFRLGYVPADFDAGVAAGFNPVYMGRLYTLGYAQARAGYPWRTAPPGLENDGEAPVSRMPCRDEGS